LNSTPPVPTIPREAASSAPIISVRGVNMVFSAPGGRETHALQEVNLDIRKGEFISLLGPSGCGKTTLLRIIADLLEPTYGTVSVFGRSPREMRVQQKYGIVFQSPVLYEWRTVRNNIRLPLEIMKVPRTEQNRRIDEHLEMVGLTKFANSYPFQLSGGMQQRVGIARALAMDPELLLMDEPFSASDEFTREKLNEDLLRLWQISRKTVIFVTHNISEAVFLSDRVVVMSPHPGRVSKVIEVDLVRPRKVDSPEFFSLYSTIRHGFEGVYHQE
jgi:NitT/TauT family transport system ATP-binding protein